MPAAGTLAIFASYLFTTLSHSMATAAGAQALARPLRYLPGDDRPEGGRDRKRGTACPSFAFR